MKLEDLSKAFCLAGLILVLLAGSWLVYDYFRQPEPFKQRPLEQQTTIVDGVQAVVPVAPSAKPSPRKRCIFAEPAIGPGCRYDDRFLAKIGRDGVKAYGWPEVNTEDNIGN